MFQYSRLPPILYNTCQNEKERNKKINKSKMDEIKNEMKWKMK